MWDHVQHWAETVRASLERGEDESAAEARLVALADAELGDVDETARQQYAQAGAVEMSWHGWRATGGKGWRRRSLLDPLLNRRPGCTKSAHALWRRYMWASRVSLAPAGGGCSAGFSPCFLSRQPRARGGWLAQRGRSRPRVCWSGSAGRRGRQSAVVPDNS